MTGAPSPGGFLHSSLPSPPPSSIGDASIASSALPHPRNHPLKLGSVKETAFINHVDSGIARAQGRFAKRTGPRDPNIPIDEEAIAAAGNLPGYRNFGEAGRDLEQLIEIVWISGTPSLQISYLLSLALLLTSFIPAFSPPSPRTMFRVLRKMDSAFASLLQGYDTETGQPLPGFETRKKIVSGTEKVRIKSSIEKTRVLVTEKLAESSVIEADDADEHETEDEYDMDGARVYEQTLVELGDELGDAASPSTDYERLT